MYKNIKYDKLDTHSHNSFDSDEPLLNPDNVQLEIYNNNSNQNNQTNQTNQENIENIEILKKDNLSRCIMRQHIANIIIFSICMVILIFGFIDLKNTDSNNIIYTDYGYKLYSYYYYINFVWYFAFLLLSLYLIFYAIFYNCCNVIRDTTYFRMMKINYICLSLNIFTKILYGFFIFMLTYHGSEIQINKIPVYYNLIFVESILYMMFCIHVQKLIYIID